ncbi:MAG: hypothetical protein MUC95_00040 [Spirochaetes bacterium]|jgi:hypothetical protein|nr:hypothetical protein [Spirochaetota bacterium]
MFFKKDEYLHEFKKSPDWKESYSINIIDKKNRVFGFTDVDYRFNKRQVEFSYVFVIHDEIFRYENVVPFNNTPEEKTITDKKVSYIISAPQETFQLNLKGKKLAGNLKLTALFPPYAFPTSMPATEEEPAPQEITVWNRYVQRCKTQGSMVFTTAAKKEKKARVECFAQREHQWGFRLTDSIVSSSNIAVQFRDMLMNLIYIEFADGIYASGIVSRKSGNIPIQNVECELISFDRKKNEISSSEFSFTDAHDEVDLIVSRKIHSLQMPVPKNRKRFIRFRNFSDFTIVGTNKKGVGMEEHYLSIDRLGKF